MATFTLYWRDGRREVVRGSNPADAMNQRGYGYGALRALDFYARGTDNHYQWNEVRHEWIKAKSK